VYTAVEEVFSVSGLGKTNQQVDVTNFDSPAGTMEYIAGLADGEEITVEANYLPAGTQQIAMMAAVDAGANRKFQVTYTKVSPNKTFTFTGTPLSYKIVPSATDKNTIQFTVKVSGDITRA
jgi:hypothetical protein